jgi:hypothetical protein
MTTGKHNIDYGNKVPVGGHVFPDEVEKWCQENCKGEWGWFWEIELDGGKADFTSYVSFANEDDLIDFMLMRGDLYNGKSVCK